jgi:hypothetical protein
VNRVSRLCWIAVACMLVVGIAQAQQVKRGAKVYYETKHDVSMPLRDMAKMVPAPTHVNREIENRPGVVIKSAGNPAGVDAAVQTEVLPLVGTQGLLNFDGQGADGVAPPDTEGAVGATQYVQWVNLEYNVYDKTTGTKTLGPIQGNAIWSGFGGVCSTNNDGDPIVVYDKSADRWFFAQNVFVTPYTVCIAVSTTNDATGSYNRYSFAVKPTSDFPDYPKWGVWPDGYYLSFNAFGTFSEVGAQACAADRVNMLAGNAATMQCFTTPAADVNLLPSDQDGLTQPPAGSPNYYVDFSSTASLNFWQFHVDFVNPSNSTFTGPTTLAITPFTQICIGNRACIPEPSPGEKVDSLGDRLMYRFAYRNFGSHESLVLSHTVKPTGTSTATAAVRWYEIRSPKTPKIFQTGTVQDKAISFWMPSIAMDKNGDIALGFSAASSTMDPSVLYTGRVPTDPINKMETNKIVVKGTGVQKNTSNRWGDYSDMQVDPVDDCTFWYTQEYYKTTGSFNWATRINSFKFPGCK